jgi:hypothetical protein
MARNELGDLRRSAAAAGFGPGAVIDFRADGGAPVSGVAAGLEEWDRNFPPGGMRHPQAINEERLQKKLRVSGFRLAPVRDPNNDHDLERALVAVRFPAWLQCPRCDTLAREDEWASEIGRASRWCAPCSKAALKRIYVIPVRFVMACENGHLDEFPWHSWVSHVDGCPNRDGALKLVSEGAGLAGIVLSCPKCSARRNMDRIFSKDTWKRFPDCRGRRPWLAAPHEHCDLKARAVQRGASNLYFPLVESALSIPPWSNRLQEALGVWWQELKDTDPEDLPATAKMLARNSLKAVLEELGMTPDMLVAEISQRVDAWQNLNTSNLRLDEYRQLTGGAAMTSVDEEFEIRPQPVPAEIAGWFSRIVKVVRLREVRAITGFTRIQPPGDPQSKKIASLSVNRGIEWLPAVEVRGEGIFLELNRETLEAWETQQAVVERARVIDERWRKEWAQRHGSGQTPDRDITPRFLLLHTLAHALMRQLTLDCGYSSTALRERLYANDPSMCGLLIYTATTDDDGTLGGLARQGEPQPLRRTIEAAIAAQAWCSSDPLCIEDLMNDDDALSLAACHSCVLAPETSCEEFNRFLDRAALVGTPADGSLGFFSELTSESRG